MAVILKYSSNRQETRSNTPVANSSIVAALTVSRKYECTQTIFLTWK